MRASPNYEETKYRRRYAKPCIIDGILDHGPVAKGVTVSGVLPTINSTADLETVVSNIDLKI
ncbi:hypothetical protein ANO14919_067700 [Xylariales sp. No.14919]|nr:hypothetical protein ANO14919_067700 [Xylariales sp. No.14919]